MRGHLADSARGGHNSSKLFVKHLYNAVSVMCPSTYLSENPFLKKRKNVLDLLNSLAMFRGGYFYQLY